MGNVVNLKFVRLIGCCLVCLLLATGVQAEGLKALKIINNSHITQRFAPPVQEKNSSYLHTGCITEHGSNAEFEECMSREKVIQRQEAYKQANDRK